MNAATLFLIYFIGLVLTFRQYGIWRLEDDLLVTGLEIFTFSFMWPVSVPLWVVYRIVAYEKKITLAKKIERQVDEMMAANAIDLGINPRN
jgi:hypothetical protein